MHSEVSRMYFVTVICLIGEKHENARGRKELTNNQQSLTHMHKPDFAPFLIRLTGRIFVPLFWGVVISSSSITKQLCSKLSCQKSAPSWTMSGANAYNDGKVLGTWAGEKELTHDRIPGNLDTQYGRELISHTGFS